MPRMAGVRVGVVLLLASSICTASCDICDDTVKARVPSADGQLIAFSYQRGCGATTLDSSVVTVQSPSSAFNAQDGTVFVAEGQFDVSLDWTGPRSLRVTCLTCTRNDVFRQVTALGKVDVTYVLARPTR